MLRAKGIDIYVVTDAILVDHFSDGSVVRVVCVQGGAYSDDVDLEAMSGKALMIDVRSLEEAQGAGEQRGEGEQGDKEEFGRETTHETDSSFL